MGVQSPNLMRNKKTCRAIGIPTIDLLMDRTLVSQLIIRACEEHGFFKLTNHGVSSQIISRIEEESYDFFAKPGFQKQQAGPLTPFGYGCKSIGFHGDKGELEYLLLDANPASSIPQTTKAISNDPEKFSCVVDDYVQAVRDLTCDILHLVAEGLGLADKSTFSRLIDDVESDSVFRVNHYPPMDQNQKVLNPISKFQMHDTNLPNNATPSRVGFGEHSDPQILTILRSNDVGGLQICSRDGLWVSVPPNPSEFCVLVGDAFQALTNDRFKGVRHRVMANSNKPRLSMMYFGAPSLNAMVSPLPQMVSSNSPTLYKPFTWGEFKKAAFSLRLAGRRLDQFKSSQLRCLNLASGDITNEGLIEMVQKPPLLDELHLYCINISKKDIKAIGHSCPHLKTFRLNYKGNRDVYLGCDENALATEKTTPGLRHLQLFGNRVTRDGLLAIIDNCPHCNYMLATGQAYMASLMLLLEALVRGQHDIAMECDPAEKYRESLQGNIEAGIRYTVYNCARGSSSAEKEMHTWKIAQICIWP
ncbi:Gibberellin 2-beta-dioxygenase 2 [Heracleum sosnowskyi]|uniref:gibberellin 2beta-dioxygenase n=1 Tax=Heracleum sosnowskyi TaxID=360622 RepID=A0AAD8JA51_9APIA|nr:Gibberellin 2-beta-dioxygenase 2 [Heracleum sosnowskyi]